MPSLSMSFVNEPVTTPLPGSPLSSPRASTPGGTLFLSPTSPTEAGPSHVANVADMADREPEVSPHAFCPKTDSDSRGPCPALNTLANHGYLCVSSPPL
ncbi:hypothetical protein JB92DRAFT_2860693 [Gautieria morchelliformis]|nr:hypothetical protein JB92DRAFT_2860693 [Gautieria morchelliformis]